MAQLGSVGLFELDPDLSRFVPQEDRPRAGSVRLPVSEIAPGKVDVRGLLRSAGAFSAVTLDGMLLQSMRLDGRSGLRLLGPGSMLSLADSAPSLLLEETSLRATVPTRAVLLARDFLLAARHWPWLVAGLNARSAEQARYLANQLMICQLPRVDDRLMAMMWLLAESWGRVTTAGTLLPIRLTHSVLGGLIGARRPTVSLALRALSDEGAMLRQADGWLLLKPATSLPTPRQNPVYDPRPVELAVADPVLTGAAPAPLSDTAIDAGLSDSRSARDTAAYAELSSTVTRLRAKHDEAQQRLGPRPAAIGSSRQSATERRERIIQQRESPPVHL